MAAKAKRTKYQIVYIGLISREFAVVVQVPGDDWRVLQFADTKEIAEEIVRQHKAARKSASEAMKRELAQANINGRLLDYIEGRD